MISVGPYEVGPDDLRVLNQYRPRQPGQLVIIYVLTLMGCGVALIVAANLLGAMFVPNWSYLLDVITSREFGILLFGLLVCALIVVCFSGIWFQRRMSSWLHARNPSYRQAISLSFDADGLSITNDVTSSKTKWIGIHSVCETPSHLVCFMAPTMGNPIPKKLFGDAAGQDDALKQIRGRVEQAGAEYLVLPAAGAQKILN